MQIANKKALLQGLLSFVKQNNFLCTKSIIFECDDSNLSLHKSKYPLLYKNFYPHITAKIKQKNLFFKDYFSR